MPSYSTTPLPPPIRSGGPAPAKSIHSPSIRLIQVGASVSADLRSKAILSVVLSMLGVIAYLALRFDFRFSVAATVATFHDVLAVLGICWLMDKEITLLIITALLTLAGYSLNDTVVIFDRIRENMHKEGAGSFYQIINDSINQVLGRSFITGLSVLFCLTSLFFFGGATLHDFSFALLVGIAVAFFSSVFVASPLLVLQGDHTK